MSEEKATRPTVGRIVHYVSYGSPLREDGTQAYESECRAAVITEVPKYLPEDSAWAERAPNGTDGNWVAGLCVLNPTGQFFNQGAEYHGGETGTLPGGAETTRWHRGGTWHWPERAG